MKRMVLLLMITLVCFGLMLAQQNVPVLDQQIHDTLLRAWNGPHPSSTGTDGALTLLGRWAYGPCQAVAARGNYAFIGNGATLQAIDMSNPSSPLVVGERVVAYVYDIQMKDSLALVCAGDSLILFDASQPTLLPEAGGVSIYGGAERAVVQDSFAYVLGFNGLLTAIDLSDPVNPRLRGNTPTSGLNFGGGVFAVKGRILYVSSTYNLPQPVYIFDASDPDTIREMGHVYMGWEALSAAIKDTLLFVSSVSDQPLQVYSISDPASPQFLSGSGLGPTGMMVRDSILYATTGTGFYSIDISDPINLKPRGTVNLKYATGKIALLGPYAFAEAHVGVFVLGVGNADSLKEISFIPTGGWAGRIALKDSLAFVASWDAGLWIVNFSDPTKPKGLSNINPGSNASDVAVSGNYAYLMNDPAYSADDTSRGLWIIDVSDPSQPRLVSHHIGIVRYSTTALLNSIAKSGQLIFVTQSHTSGNDSVAEIVDVSNPAEPKEIGVVRGGYDCYDAAAADTQLYLANGGFLSIFNLRDPTNPTEVARLQRTALAVEVRDTLAYVMSESLLVVSVADPRSPFILGAAATPSGYGMSDPDLTVAGNFAYWADGDGGAIDISNPRSPVQRISLSGTDRGRGVASDRGLIYYGDTHTGVWIWRNNLVTSVGTGKTNLPVAGYKLLQNYPNPFNGRTTVEFEVPVKGRATLEVFDILGQRVALLLDAVIEPGLHRVLFNAEEASSGVYFCRLRANGHAITSPMLYVK